jgi:hypothetical protein
VNYFTPRRDVMCAIIFLRSPAPRTITTTAMAKKLAPATAKQNVQKYHQAVVIAMFPWAFIRHTTPVQRRAIPRPSSFAVRRDRHRICADRMPHKAEQILPERTEQLSSHCCRASVLYLHPVTLVGDGVLVRAAPRNEPATIPAPASANARKPA